VHYVPVSMLFCVGRKKRSCGEGRKAYENRKWVSVSMLLEQERGEERLWRGEENVRKQKNRRG